MTLQTFYLAEIDVRRPGSGNFGAQGDAWAAMPWGAVTEYAPTVDSSETLYVSDFGYRSRAADAIGVRPYPARLNQAFTIDRRMNLDPSAAAVAAGWGSLTLFNVGGYFDAWVVGRNADGRTLRILAGAKTPDAARGILIDPAYSTMVPVVSGVATPWALSETTLEIPLRDPTYWIERPIQTAIYSGGGSYNGGADLAGKPKPITRGTAKNVAPVLMDAANLIFQYTDNAGTVAALYEGGDTNITFQANTSNLYAGTTSPGQYRTDNSRGLFQLGSAPVRQITADVTGAFASGVNPTTLFAIAKQVLLQDLALPSAYLDGTSFDNADSAFSYSAGFYLDATPNEGVAVVGFLLGSAGAKLIPTRTGTLHAFVLRALVGTETPDAAYTTAEIVALNPVGLPSSLNPPPWRWRVGYQHNYTAQASGFSPSITAARQGFIVAADRFTTYTNSTTATNYRRPSDPAPITTALQSSTDAQAVANAFGALWSGGRLAFDLVLPLNYGIRHELGAVLQITYPASPFRSGAKVQVVGEQINSANSTVTLQVLV